jgi:hypothetical protein
VQLSLKYGVLAYTRSDDFRGKSILDFGCGSGASAVILARMFPESRIVGVDIEAKFILLVFRWPPSESLTSWTALSKTQTRMKKHTKTKRILGFVTSSRRFKTCRAHQEIQAGRGFSHAPLHVPVYARLLLIALLILVPSQDLSVSVQGEYFEARL